MDNNTKMDYINKYNSVGEIQFYKYLLSSSIDKLLLISKNNYTGSSPEIDLLNHSEKFLYSYRRNNDVLHLKLSFILRRAANKIYRVMLKKNMIKKNSKFLNLI